MCVTSTAPCIRPNHAKCGFLDELKHLGSDPQVAYLGNILFCIVAQYGNTDTDTDTDTATAREGQYGDFNQPQTALHSA